ncbi:MAG: HAD family hydrolase [Gemmatimonadota bacterium]
MNLAVFDVDGTLLDNLEEEDVCFARALSEELALSKLDTDWAQYTHVSDDAITSEAYTREYGQPLTAAQRAATIERFLDHLRMAHGAAPITAVRGATQMLSDLRSRGWAVAFATGAWRRAAEYKLGASGIPLAGVPWASSEDGPARETIVAKAIELATASLGVTPFTRVVAIGDGLWDLHTARTLRLPFVGIGAGDRGVRLRTAGASHVIADYSDFDGVVRAFEEAKAPCAAL